MPSGKIFYLTNNRCNAFLPGLDIFQTWSFSAKRDSRSTCRKSPGLKHGVPLLYLSMETSPIRHRCRIARNHLLKPTLGFRKNSTEGKFLFVPQQSTRKQLRENLSVSAPLVFCGYTGTDLEFVCVEHSEFSFFWSRPHISFL